MHNALNFKKYAGQIDMDLPLKFSQLVRLIGSFIILLAVMPLSVSANWVGKSPSLETSTQAQSNFIAAGGNEIEIRAELIRIAPLH